MATIKGKWILNKVLPISDKKMNNSTTNFTSYYSSSDGEKTFFVGFIIVTNGNLLYYYNNFGETTSGVYSVLVYNGAENRWLNEKSRIIDFGLIEQTIPDDLHSWITTNGKQLINPSSDYLQELIHQKKSLANNLVEKGIEATEDEKFNTLVPKVLNIPKGVPIEIDSLDSSLLIKENEGKVYKYNGKLYRIVGDAEGTKTLIGLTGATVTVPPGFRCVAGFGRFQLFGSIIHDSKTRTLSNEELNFAIGYNGGINSLYSNAIVYRYKYSYNSNEHYSLPHTKSFTLNIIGGADVANKSLIQWFQSVNAAITGGTYEYSSFIFQEILSPTGELNIHYGLEAPEDTSKLWVKLANAPSKVEITNKLNGGNETLDAGINTLPTACYCMGCTSIGNKIYLFGGKGSNYLNAINVFDAETNTITTLSTTLPTACYDMGCASVGTKIYLFGGRSGSSSYLNAINVFDTETNKIETLFATLPTACSSIGCASVGTKIYLFGGRSSNSGTYLNTINVFNTETNTITTLSTLPAVYGEMDCTSVGTKIYLFGGITSGSTVSNAINVFDAETNTITTLSTTLPTACYDMGCASVGTKIYLFGGSSYLNTINVFDTETNTITTLSTTLPTACYGIGCASVGAKIYLFGGYNNSYLFTINRFIIQFELENGTLLIHNKLGGTKVSIIKTDNMAVEIEVDSILLGNSENLGEEVEANINRKSTGFINKQYTSSATQLESGTELTATIECNVGDLVVAAIATRDTLTVSEGWTLVSTSEINSTDTAGNGHRLSWAYKYAESTTESITVTQASEQRLYINMVALQGATGVTDNGYSYRDDTTSGDLTVTKPSGLVLWGMTSPLWDSSSPYEIWTSSNNMPIIQLGTSTQSRLGIGLDQSEDESVTLIGGSDASTIIVGCLTVQGMDKFYDVIEYDDWVKI